jgi:hypothetical protein
VDISVKLREVQLQENIKHLESTPTSMNSMVWKVCAPPRINFFCMASNPKADLDGRPFGKEGMTELWIGPTLQANHGVYLTPILQMPVHH